MSVDLADSISGKMSEVENSNGESMHIDAKRAAHLAENLGHVYQRIQRVANGRKVRGLTSAMQCPEATYSLISFTGPSDRSLQTQTSQ